MKHQFTHLLMILLLLCIFSCNWQIPKSVEIKSTPTYELTLGTLPLDLGEKLKSQVLSTTSEVNETAGLKFYEPANNDNIFHMLVECPVEEIDFNFSNELSKLSFDSALDSAIPNFSYTIPEAAEPLVIAEKTLPTIPSVVSSIQPYTLRINLPEFVTVMGEEGFVEGTISTGSIKYSFDLKGLDSGWNYTIDSINIDLVQNNGFNLSKTFTDFSGEKNKPEVLISLDNQTFNSSEINCSGYILITFKNIGSGTPSYSGVITTSIGKFSSVKLELPDDYNLEVNQSEIPPKEMLEFVDYIDFEKVGFNIKCNNSLPEGNDIGINISSNLFGINDTGTFAKGEATVFVGEEYTPLFHYIPDEEDLIDFRASIVLPGYEVDDIGKKYFTLTNIEAGSTLEFSSEVSLVTDWDEVKVSPNTEALTTTQSIPSINGLLGDQSKLKFNKVNAYLFLQYPSDKIDMTVNVDATSGEEDISFELLKTGYPELKYDPDNNNIVISLNTENANEIEISKLITDNPIDFTCTVEMGSIVLKYDEIQENSKFGLYLYIDIPFDFTLLEDFPISIGGDSSGSTEGGDTTENTVTNEEEVTDTVVLVDESGTTEESEDFSLDTLYDSLDMAQITLEYVNKTGLSINAVINGIGTESKEFSIEKTDSTDTPKTINITLEGDDIAYLSENGLQNFGATLTFPKGDFIVSRNPVINLKLIAKIDLNLDQTIQLQPEIEE